MSNLQFLNGLSYFFSTTSQANNTESTPPSCDTNIDHYLFYQYSLIPAVVLTLIMASTKSRRQKLLNVFNGRPSLVFPLDSLSRSSRISYCCAFGAIGFLVYQILLEGRFAISYNGPTAIKTLIAILSMFIYGMVFFPVFTSLALETAMSFFIGTLYVWMIFIIEVYKMTECDLNAAGRVLLLTRSLPSLLCLAYLSISLPIKCGLAIYNKNYIVPELGEEPYRETVAEVRNSYQGKHVRKLLRKPKAVRPPEGFVQGIKKALAGILGDWLYHRQSGFRYPTRFVSAMFVAACVIYVFTVELFVEFLPPLNYFLDVAEQVINAVQTVDESKVLEEENVDYATVYFLYYLIEVVRACLIVAVSLSCAISYLTILHMMSSFRTNLFALYKGDYSRIPAPSTKSAIALCTGSIKYAGFQVAYIVWAFLIMGIVLFIICVALAVVISLCIVGYSDWLVNKVLQVWPGLLIAIGLFVTQFLLAKFVFLQDKGQHLRLDNRRFFFIFNYFMFFYNIFLGLVSCLMRIIKAILVGTFFLSRLDNSTLPRKFEFLDPGFSAYQGYIHMEVAHTHPVVNVFIRLLVALSNSRKDKSSYGQNTVIEMEALDVETDRSLMEKSTEYIKRTANPAARFHWFTIYTLLQNPSVRIYRKGFIQSIKRAREEGIKIPISDHPISDFDLVKALEEKEKEEAARKSKLQSHNLSQGLAMLKSLTRGDSSGLEVQIKSQKKTPKLWFQKLRRTSPDNLSDVAVVENEHQDSST